MFRFFSPQDILCSLPATIFSLLLAYHLTEKGYPSSNIQMENRFPQITNSSRTADSCGS